MRGAAFALELARSGYRVTVVEKAPAAHHKVCGEFLGAEAQRLITYLGLDVWALGATPARKLQLACRQASTTLELPFLGAGLSRSRLDEALLRAAEAAGAEIVRGATVTRLEWTEQSVTVRASGQEFRAVHAALASGKQHDKARMRISRAVRSNATFGKVRLFHPPS